VHDGLLDKSCCGRVGAIRDHAIADERNLIATKCVGHAESAGQREAFEV